MFLQTILFTQLSFTFFIIFFIKTFLSNKNYFIIFIFSYLLMNFFIVGLFIFNIYHINFYNPDIEYNIFLHKQNLWGLTLVIKNSLNSYLCLWWYNTSYFLKPNSLIFYFYTKQGVLYYYSIFFTFILLISSIHKCFLFFKYFSIKKIDNKSFPLSVKAHFEFIFFVKYSFLFEFLITAFYFVRIIYVPGSY
jgi:hypothetical protein